MNQRNTKLLKLNKEYKITCVKEKLSGVFINPCQTLQLVVLDVQTQNPSSSLSIQCILIYISFYVVNHDLIIQGQCFKTYVQKHLTQSFLANRHFSKQLSMCPLSLYETSCSM